MTIRTSIIGLFFAFQTFAHAAVLVEEGRQRLEPKNDLFEQSDRLEMGDHQEHHSVLNLHSNSIGEMHSEKRVAAGIEFFGKTGLLGITGDFAFLPYDKATMGFGGGPGYVAMTFGYKHLFSDSKLSPYVGASLARWASSSSVPVDSTNPAFLGQKFLTDDEKQTGKFAHNFVIPSAGLQWTEVAKNAAFFGEVLALVDAGTFNNIYTGAVGMLYYF